jgi:cytochrome b561
MEDRVMTVSATDRRYDRLSRLLHWALGVLIVVQFVIGWTMPHVGRKTIPVGLVGAHVTVGVLIVLLVAVRVIWWAVRKAPAARPTSSATTKLATLVHVLLYACMVVLPGLGWANANARGWIVGVSEMFAPDGSLPDIRLPAIMESGSKLGHDMGDVHGQLAWVLAVLIGLHVLAGLYHHFIKRDGTLKSML